jgi:hypothetical protein
MNKNAFNSRFLGHKTETSCKARFPFRMMEFDSSRFE